MSGFSVAPNYKNADPHVVDLLADTETNLPVVTAAGSVKAPAKIFVQAPSDNDGNVFIGPTGVLTDGTKAIFEIQPGESLYLPNHLIDFWKFRSTLANKVRVTYFEGVF